jgi:hypothetical protein
MRVGCARETIRTLEEKLHFAEEDGLHTFILTNPTGESLVVGCIFDVHQWFHNPGIFATKDNFFETALGDYYWLLSDDRPLTDEEILALRWSDSERDGTVPGTKTSG